MISVSSATNTRIPSRRVQLRLDPTSWVKSSLSFGKVGGPSTGANKLPQKLVVSQNYPNPFNPSTTIKYAMPLREQVSIKVYNLHGAMVTTLLDGIQDAGDHSVIWNGKDRLGSTVSTGVYLYKVRTRDSEVVKKMALIK